MKRQVRRPRYQFFARGGNHFCFSGGGAGPGGAARGGATMKRKPKRVARSQEAQPKEAKAQAKKPDAKAKKPEAGIEAQKLVANYIAELRAILRQEGLI